MRALHVEENVARKLRSYANGYNEKNEQDAQLAHARRIGDIADLVRRVVARCFMRLLQRNSKILALLDGRVAFWQKSCKR